jgi:hypothetical protein
MFAGKFVMGNSLQHLSDFEHTRTHSAPRRFDCISTIYAIIFAALTSAEAHPAFRACRDFVK